MSDGDTAALPRLDAPLTPEQVAEIAEYERRRDEAAAAEVGHRPTVAQSLAISRAVRECPHRGPAACGCEAMASCALGRGPRGGDVSHSDCWECQRGEMAGVSASVSSA